MQATLISTAMPSIATNADRSSISENLKCLTPTTTCVCRDPVIKRGERDRVASGRNGTLLQDGGDLFIGLQWVRCLEKSIRRAAIGKDGVDHVVRQTDLAG